MMEITVQEKITQLRSTDNRFLYRKLKKVLKTKKPVDVYTQLIEDLRNLKE